jgi:hypothetical protein
MSVLDSVEKQMYDGNIYQLKHNIHENFKKTLNLIDCQQKTFDAILKSLVSIRQLLNDGVTEIIQTDMSLDYERLTSSATAPIHAVNHRPSYVFRFNSDELYRLQYGIYDIQNQISRSEVFFNELYIELKQNEQELQDN